MTPIRTPNILVNFGKYRGRSVAAVAAEDPRYLTWMASLPVVRSNAVLWASVRGHLIAQLQAEIEIEALA